MTFYNVAENLVFRNKTKIAELNMQISSKDLKSRRPKPAMKVLTDSHLLNPNIRLYTEFQPALSSFNFSLVKSKATDLTREQ